jgi:beta-glucosidase
MHFLWGAATSSHQVEGNNIHNDWWQWEAAGRTERGARSGAAADHWHRFREDLDLAKSLHLNSYRFSIEWSRIQPSPDKFDDSALEWYSTLVDECEKRKLVPMVTLHHFTLPDWVAQKGGLLWKGLPRAFEKYVQRVVHRLGDRVSLWCTVNEPVVLAIGGHLAGFMPPGRFEPARVGDAIAAQFRCHVLAYDAIHQGSKKPRRGAWRDEPVQVGFAHNMIDFVPARKWHPLEVGLAAVFSRFYNRAWLDAVTGGPQHFGVRGIVNSPAPVENARGRVTTDFIGINYYTKCYVRWGRDTVGANPLVTNPQANLLPVQLTFSGPDDEVSQLGWAIHPRGFEKMVAMTQRYSLPIYITENGIADPTDQLRAAYLRSHLKSLARAMKHGADVRGYFHWSLIDNFEWTLGFGPRFGLIDIDYATQTRRPRASAEYYRQIIETHRGGTPNDALLEALHEPS